jgi:hypothetical protein
VRFSSTEAYWPVTPTSWRIWCDAEDARRPAVDRQQRGEHLQGRGLAGAVGSQHAVDLARADGQVDAVHSHEVAEALHQAVSVDRQV